MAEMEKYKEHIEYTFNGFCKTVLYHASITICRKLRRKQQHEVSLDYLKEIHIEPESMDKTFVLYNMPTVFRFQGTEIVIENERLAGALMKLPEKRREVLFLRFFLGFGDAEIGKLYGRCRSTVNRRKNVALRLLRKEMEKMRNEE